MTHDVIPPLYSFLNEKMIPTQSIVPIYVSMFTILSIDFSPQILHVLSLKVFVSMPY
jgi:hypothetical protein